MVDLYWQFAAWAKQPLMITNWTAVLFYSVALALIHGLWRDIRDLRKNHNKLLDVFARTRQTSSAE